jgi:protein disulfide-isomerase
MHKKNILLCSLALSILTPLGGYAQPPVRWEVTLENAQRVAAQTNRLVLIHFWAPWCGICRQMEAEVLSQPAVIAELTADYVPVKINADHFPATAQQYGVTTLPTTVIITPQGQALDVMRGRIETAQYVTRLNQVATDVKRRAAGVYAQVPPSTASQAPSAPTGLSDDRYADHFNRTQPPPPIGAPPPATQPATPFPTQTPVPALATSAYAAQSPPPAARVPPQGPPPPAVAAQQPSMPAAGDKPPQVPAGNPPLGMDGYCPVTLCEKQQWALGDHRWGAIHRGRTYLFTGQEEQRRFLADPDRYAPVISGNDAVLAIDQGQTAPGMREHGVYFGNRVYLFSSEASLEKFSKNPNVYANHAAEALRTGSNPGQQVQ